MKEGEQKVGSIHVQPIEKDIVNSAWTCLDRIDSEDASMFTLYFREKKLLLRFPL